VYALAATVHWVITGHKPPAAVGRMVNDTLAPLAEVAAGRYSPRFLAALDAALQVKPADRTADMAQFRAALGLGAAPVPQPAPPVAPTPAPTPAQAQASLARQAAPAAGSAVPPWAWGAGVALLVAAGGVWWWSQRPVSPIPPVLSPVVVSPPAPAPVAEPAPTPAPAVVAVPAPVPVPTPASAAPVRPPAVAKPEPRAEAPVRAAASRPPSVCSGLMQRLSLGEDSPALREQLVANRCQ
jgi:hypothetical protein